MASGGVSGAVLGAASASAGLWVSALALRDAAAAVWADLLAEAGPMVQGKAGWEAAARYATLLAAAALAAAMEAGDARVVAAGSSVAE